ncbi:MAG: lecithin retinol acyltransferase family protein [Baekduia sp.]
MGRADHIYVSRGIYTHHGIDAGDGTVIHFSGEPKDKRGADIRRSTLEEFLSGGTLKVRRYGFRDNADVTMLRAESRLGDKRYHLVTNNCEHFAVWCCTGRHASGQVRETGSMTAQGAVVGTAAGATTGAVASLGTVAGVSGPGIMTALSAAGGLVGGGAAMGPTVLAVPGAAASIIITQVALRDDEALPDDERAARRDGRVASVAGAGAGAVGGIAAISAAGISGLSAVGITSGLAAIGGAVGGGMVAGTVVVAAAPAVLAAGAATGILVLSRRLRKPFQARLTSSEASRPAPSDVGHEATETDM